MIYLFHFHLLVAYACLITYALCSTLPTILSYSIHSVPHFLLHTYTPHLLHTSTCVPPMAICLTCCTMHRPLLTPVDLPSSHVLYKPILVQWISLKLILLCTT